MIVYILNYHDALQIHDAKSCLALKIKTYLVLEKKENMGPVLKRLSPSDQLNQPINSHRLALFESGPLMGFPVSDHAAL